MFYHREDSQHTQNIQINIIIVAMNSVILWKKKSYGLNGRPNIFHYSHHVVHYNPMTYIFYNWRFVPFEFHYPFRPTPNPDLGNKQAILVLYGLDFLFVFQFHICEIIQYLSFSDLFHWDNALKIHPCCHTPQDLLIFTDE